MHKLLLLGGDTRQKELAKLLTDSGMEAYSITHASKSPGSLQKAMAQCDIVLCPIPFTKDNQYLFSTDEPQGISVDSFLSGLTAKHIVFGGNFPQKVRLFCAQNSIAFHDFMEIEEVSLRNAIATAEGAVAEAISHSNVNLHGSHVLVLGFGRCGKTLADKLDGLRAKVTVADRNTDTLALALALGHTPLALCNLKNEISVFRYVFNTIPAPVLNRQLLSAMQPNVTIIDIASAPGGADYAACKELGINAYLCPGLPGKYAPKASAEILYDALLQYI